MWQKCPICDGEGRVTSNGLSSSVHQVCSVCNGTKIISQLNGLPSNSIDKEQQKKLLIEIMEADEKDGLYETNNMKLYTEEQLLNTVKAIQDYLDHYDEKDAQVRIEKHLKALAPIELPSDEEIAKHMTSVWFADNMHRECFKLGAIWMKTQIDNQNK